MTATVTENTETKAGGVGRISRIIGPVVDVEFPVDAMPDLYNLLTADVNNPTKVLQIGQQSSRGIEASMALKLL